MTDKMAKSFSAFYDGRWPSLRCVQLIAASLRRLSAAHTSRNPLSAVTRNPFPTSSYLILLARTLAFVDRITLHFECPPRSTSSTTLNV